MRKTIYNIIFTLGLLVIAYAPAVHARSTFIIFPEARLNYQTARATHTFEHNTIGASLFYAYEGDKIQALAETVVYNDDQDIERLQAGWRLQPQTTVWLGLYHSPIIPWNNLFHHGAYFQTSITRPAITLFEGDEGGALQTQLFGGLLESAVPIGEGEINYSLALGIGTTVNSRRALDAMDFSRDAPSHRPNVNIRVAYRADATNEHNETGVVFSQSRMFAAKYPSEDIQQLISGAYLHLEWRCMRLLSAAYWVRNVINIGGQDIDDTFGNGYAQLECEGKPDWTILARTEGSRGTGSDAYLSMFPNFAHHRHLIGVRYDFMHMQALKLEISETKYQDGQQRAIRLQWSGGFSFP